MREEEFREEGEGIGRREGKRQGREKCIPFYILQELKMISVENDRRMMLTLIQPHLLVWKINKL